MGNFQLICDLLATRGELLQQLSGLRESTSSTRPEPAEWSVMEVLQHVADIDELLVIRLDRAKSGESQIKGYDVSEWESARKDAERGGPAGVLQRMYAARTAVLQRVSLLSPADLDRDLTHPARGPMTGLGLVEMAIRHDRDHAGQIARTRSAVEKG